MVRIMHMRQKRVTWTDVRYVIDNEEIPKVAIDIWNVWLTNIWS